ncbi:AMP-binding protein [Thermodesulfovibrio sp.]|uniref:AMP-binding protein n=1 Tax=Thermodesulfovibrio sp. TaxID=2067987 RepID=UPI0030AC4D84
MGWILAIITEMSLVEYFLEAFTKYSTKTAFNYLASTEEYENWRSLTYDDVKNYSFRLCSFLQNYISAGDRVIIYADNSPWWCISYIAIILSGAVAVPLDVEMDKQTVDSIIKNSEAKFVFYSDKTAENVKDYKGFNIEKIKDLQTTEKINPSTTPVYSPVSLIYTSGTTGIPKAVILAHENFIFQIEAIKKTDIIKSDENILCILPLHHTYPFVCSFLVPFCSGATVTFLSQIKGELILNTIKKAKITALVAVPKILELFSGKISEKIRKIPFPANFFLISLKKLSSFLRRKFDINIGKLVFFFLHLKTGKQFRFFTSGGARLDPEVMKDMEAFGFTVIEGYGLTETSPVVSFNPKNKRKPGSAGKALDGVELKIIAPDREGIGEIAVKGTLVMKGYYKNEELTRQSFQNGWFLTGDLGYIDEEGYLYITGRKKDVIVLSSGKTIYPEDVEESYRKRIPLIKEICILDTMEAIIVPDLNYARQKGIVNIKANLKWELDAVSRTLPSYMRIMGFHLYNKELPKTRLGKFRRFLIKQIIKDEEREKLKETIPEVLNETGKAIEEIIKFIIPSVKSIKPSAHLELDLGMDSISRIEFALAIEKRFSIKLTDSITNNWATVEDVIRDVDRLKGLPFVEKTEIKKHRGRLFKILQIGILMTAHLLLRIFFKSFYRLKVHGLERLPSKPFIIAPNHTSYFDGFVLFASLPFRISKNLYFQGLKKFFPYRLISEIINVIPISSDGEVIGAMERSKEILMKGFSLCIFPEGGRSFDGKLRDFQRGFAILSIQTGVPVVPVLIEGTFEALPRGKFIPSITKISVFIGAAINSEKNFSDVEVLVERVRESIIALEKEKSLS